MDNAVSGPVGHYGDRCKRARLSASIGKGDNADDGDERLAIVCGASTSRGVANDLPGVPQSQDIPVEDNERDQVLEAKHKIFLSHSGAQKSFVADLCADLMRRDRHPFFDKLRSSLPVGEKFPHLIFDAIRQCKVGVVVLSEEFFTRSKWPMLEMAAMVEESMKPNARIKIIPVFYSISRDRCRNHDVQLEWMTKHWRKWEEEDKGRIDVKRWQDTLGILGSTTGLAMRAGMVDGELRAEIVDAVCKEVPQETGWDDSSVEGKSRLFKKIYERIYKGAQPMDLKGGVLVVGLYGTGGVGKTTACKILCKELSCEYHDKVCHVEFGSAREEELLKEVLRKLSDLEVERLENLNVDTCHGYLKTRLCKDRAFVALDNVSDESAEQAKSLLRAKFGDGSVVLVTARSMVELLRLGVVKENCFAMPDLEVEEAKSLFLKCADLKESEVGEEFVRTCLSRCYFSMSADRKHYHPLALKVLGREVGDAIRGGKDERAVLSRIGDFNMSRQREHPVFSIMRSSFDSMLEVDQLLFLDITLDTGVGRYDFGVFSWTSMEWLCMVHGKDRDEVVDRLECLKRRSLLDSYCAEWYGERFHMHDLWREFAREEMKVGKFGDRRWVYKGEEDSGLGDEECFERVDLTEYPKLGAVKLENPGKGIIGVDVRGLKHLRSFVIASSSLCWYCSSPISSCDCSGAIPLEVIGLGTLERLTCLVLARAASEECISEVGLLTSLQVLDLSFFRSARLPDMSRLTKLRSLALRGSNSLECITLQNLPRLSDLNIDDCCALRRVDISGCTLMRSFYLSFESLNLEELNVSYCPLIPSVRRPALSTELRKLNITGCSSIQELDCLTRLEKLEELRARDCERLAMLPECSLSNLRVLDIESWKIRVGVVKEKCFPMLELEFDEARALFLNRANLKENDVGEEFVRTCLIRCCSPTGQSLSSDGMHYHTVALKVLGSEVADMIRGGKDESAVMSRIRDFNLSLEGEHPVFSIMRSCFEFLSEGDQLLFLDIVLGRAFDWGIDHFINRRSMEWLCVVHGKERDEMQDMLERLKRRSLLDSVGADAYGVWRFHMHDLWREFAREEMKVGKFGDRRWVYKLEQHSGSGDEEFVERVDLTEYAKLEAVRMRNPGKGIVGVDVRGLKHVRSFVVASSSLCLYCSSPISSWDCSGAIPMEVIGLGTLERLTCLVLARAASEECISEVGLLTSLQVLDLSFFRSARLPDMSRLTKLRSLALRGSNSLECINLQNLPRLTDLNIDGCTALRKLNITGCSSIQELDCLTCLEKLEELRARDCERLAMLPECSLSNLRVLDIESWKIRVGVVKEKCFPMLELEFDEARALFLNRANLKENDVGEEFVRTCLIRCCSPTGQSLSSNGMHYHTVALKVLGSEVADMIRGGKDESAVMSRIRDFNLSLEGEHPVFSIMRSCFEFLSEGDQLLFLDIVLGRAFDWGIDHFINRRSMEWLCVVHGKERDEMQDMLERLKRRSLLDSVGADAYGVWRFHMHDLWREFAREEMKVGKFGDRRWVYKLEQHSGSGDEEFVERVDLTEYAKLEAVRMRNPGKGIVGVDVRGLKHVRSFVVASSSLCLYCSSPISSWDCSGAIPMEVIGLGTLERLTCLVLARAASEECISEVGLLTSLQVLDLSFFRSARLPDMSRLTKLRSLALRGSNSLECINLQNLPRLTDLNIDGCTALRKLNITGCSSIQELDCLTCLEKLEELRARDCERLAMLPECSLSNLRVLDIESWKIRVGVVKEKCFPMLELEFDEARALFLNRANLKENDVGEEFVRTCLIRCCSPTGQSLSSNGMHYHTVALKVLGSEVADMIRGGKDESAVMSRIRDFNLSLEGEHPVFSIMRSCFEFLSEGDQLLFLDIVLGRAFDWGIDHFINRRSMEWLCVVHGKERDEMQDMLERLKRRSLLDSVGADAYGVWRFHMHDLWREFAREEMKVGKFGDRRWVYKLEQHSGSGDEEFVERVDLTEYAKLEAVRMRNPGKGIVGVDVRGLKHLRSFVVASSSLCLYCSSRISSCDCSGAIPMEVIGLGTLERLTCLVLARAASEECISEVGLLTSLQVLDLSFFRSARLPDMSRLTKLRSLALRGSNSLECINLQNLPRLTDLNIDGCTALRKLNITGCSSIQELDCLTRLEKLEELRARDCERLAMLPECSLSNLRVLDIESWKIRVGVVKEKCFPMLELEFDEARALFLNRANLKENDVGEEFVRTCLIRCCSPTGQSLSSDGMHYHTVALKVLGSEVADMIRGGKDESAVMSRIRDFNLSLEGEHPVFSIMRSCFEFLSEGDQLLFLDIALGRAFDWGIDHFIIGGSMEWLCVVHGKERDEMQDMLERLKRRSLLDSVGADAYGVWRFHMHDLWREFAREEMKVGKFGDRRGNIGEEDSLLVLMRDDMGSF